MDNDRKSVRLVRETAKKMKFFWDYFGLKVQSDEEGNSYIRELLKSDMPFAVIRGGATELRCVAEYLKKKNFSTTIREQIHMLSGVFPPDENLLERFCSYYMIEMRKADVLCVWGVGAESKVVHRYCKNTRLTKLRAVEPYYFENPWSENLQKKKVLVIHPFQDSILRQYEKRRQLWGNNKILPEMKALTCIKAIQSAAGQKSNYKTWFDALEFMKSEINKADFDTAIIGAGAYSLPLATHCKSIGKQAIQMSGATQILFGIKGKRWDNKLATARFYNDAWVRPTAEETPPKARSVEGGCYW